MEKILEISHLTKRFKKLTAVQDLNLSVEKGNIYGLLGPNGSGKSTTLGMILNVVNPTSGTWRWFGKEHTTDVLKKVGAIIEHPNFYPYLSAKKNLEIVAQIKGVDYSKIEEKLKLVGMLDRKDDDFSTYSLGMKQRLAIASAMLNDPYVLILDEPTNGLDPQGIIQIRSIIKDIAEGGTTIIMASHLLDEVEKICSHVVIIENGKTLYNGRVDEVTSSFGYFELAAKDNAQLMKTLQSLSTFDGLSEDKNKIKAILKEDLSAEELNQLLFEKGIVLTHLVKRKESLEAQFLEITKKQN